MNITEANELKDSLEDKIEHLIKEFEETTGLTVEHIEMERLDFSSKENPNHKPLHYVTTKVTL